MELVLEGITDDEADGLPSSSDEDDETVPSSSPAQPSSPPTPHTEVVMDDTSSQPQPPPSVVPMIVAIVPSQTLPSKQASIRARHINQNLGGTALVVPTGKNKLGPPPAGITHIATGYP